jgi:hypothetical protein
MDDVVPVASIFGPKIGAFYANLTGNHDALTIDLWQMRAMHAIAGSGATPEGVSDQASDLIPLVEKIPDAELDGFSRNELLTNLRALQAGEADLWFDSPAWQWAHKRRMSYAKDAYKDKRPSHVKTGPLWKQLVEVEDAPGSSQRRRNMQKLMEAAVDKLQSDIPGLTVAEAQADLWYLVQDMYRHVGVHIPQAQDKRFGTSAEQLVKNRTSKKKSRPSADDVAWPPVGYLEAEQLAFNDWRESIPDDEWHVVLEAIASKFKHYGPGPHPGTGSSQAVHGRRGFKPPKKTVKAYKLFRTLKTKPGQYFPLFIGKTQPVPVGKWIEAEFLPTEGFAHRPGWHAGHLPIAPHLRSKKTGKKAADRVWAEVEMPADVDWQSVADANRTGDIRDQIPAGGHYRFATNKMQGGAWLIGGAIKVTRILDDKDVSELLEAAGYQDDEIAAEMSGQSSHAVSRKKHTPGGQDHNQKLHGNRYGNSTKLVDTPRDAYKPSERWGEG